MLTRKLLFVVVLRADKAISGLAYRLLATSKHFYDKEKRGWVYIVTTVSLWEKCYPEEKPDPRYIKLIDDRRFYKPKMFFLWLRCLLYILIYRIRIMHTNGNYLLLPIHYLKNIFGYKTVVTFGSANIQMASSNNNKIAKQWRAVLNAASAVDVLNPINTIDGYKSRKFISVCSFPSNMKELEKHEIQIKKENIITFVGSLTPQKNPILAIEGFEIYLQSSNLISKPILHIIGKGPLAEELERRINKLNKKFGNNTAILHKDDNLLLETLAKSRVFLSLQNHTNYPSQSLMEAMIFGNDIIATDFGDTNEMVKPLNNNILVFEKDAQLINNALHELLSRPAAFNIRNAEFIRNNHNVELFAKYLFNLYGSL